MMKLKYNLLQNKSC